MSGIRFTDEQLAAYLARFKTVGDDSAAIPVADVESNPKHGSPPKDVGESVHSRFRIHVHSRRRRLTDPDGVSAKAAIDGLVKGGLLADDSAKHIDAVTFSQERAEIEETVIEIYEVLQ